MSKEVFLSGIIRSMKINNYIFKQKKCAVFVHAQADYIEQYFKKACIKNIFSDICLVFLTMLRIGMYI